MTRGKTILLIIAVAVVFAVAGVITALYRARTFTARPPAKAAPPPGPGSSLPWHIVGVGDGTALSGSGGIEGVRAALQTVP